MDVAMLLALADRCAPSVAPETLLSVAYTESRFNPYAIGVNGGGRLSRQPSSKPEAVRVARELIRAGRNIDLGLGQINSSNLTWLRLSVEDVFDPCRNLAASAQVLEHGYRSGARRSSDPQAALKIALSMYNTGDTARGFRNGYVSKVVASAGRVVPAIAAVQGQPVRTPTTPPPASPPPAAVPSEAEAGLGEAVVLQRADAAADVAVAAASAAAPPAEPERPSLDVFSRRKSTSPLVFGR